MNKLVEWLKADSDNTQYRTPQKRSRILLRAVLAAFLPLLCCLVYCAVQGESIGRVYLPASEWNDELFYYKQVEGIVKYGYPIGYFGFNESHALKLSFAAWSPVLVFPWILWGLAFGWNLLSPILCNIVLLTLAVFLFMCLVRPTWKQTGVLAFLFCLYTLFARYMLSGMPEVICFSLLILFYGLAVNDLNRERLYKLVLLFALSGLLTLMRPYMLLFMLLPMYLCIRRYRAKGAVCSVAAAGAVLACYASIKHYLGAEYFAPLFFTDWITTFFDEGIVTGIHNFFGTLYWMGKGFLSDMIQGFRTGLASGAFFGGYTVMMLVLIGQSLADWMRLKRYRAMEEEWPQRQSGGKTERTPIKVPDRKDMDRLKSQLIVEAHLAVCFVGMLLALLLMYKLTEGSKHLLTFMAAGIFVAALMETRAYKKAALIGAVFAYLFSYKAVDPYDYQAPFAEEALCEQVEDWRELFGETISMTQDEVPSFDNVIIWTFNDSVEGKTVNTRWQLLYALPEGMGISCCTKEYLEDHFDELNSRYIALPSGGELDRMCRETGYVEIGKDADMAVWQMY